MGDKVKVSVLETNGVEELEGPSERRLTADIVELDPPINSLDDIDAFLRSLTLATGSIYETIWAEENAGISNNQREYSFGNGSTGAVNVAITYDGRIEKAFIHAASPGITASIDIMINNVVAGTATFSGNGVFTFPTAIDVVEGDFLGFRTNTVSGSWTDVRVGVALAQTIVGIKGDKGDQGDPGVPGPTDHGGLTGLGDDDHPQYLNETRHDALPFDNPHNVNQTQVGLGNVDNTSDADKPVSTAQAAALDLKYDASNPNGYETPAQLDARDTANRDRANHTGTQLSSTISDFAATVRNTLLTGLSTATNAVVEATDTVLEGIGKLQAQINFLVNSLISLLYAERSSVFPGLINQTNTLEQYAIFTANVPVAGDYKISWAYQWSLNDGAQDFIAELRVDGVTYWRQQQEPKDVAGSGVVLPIVGGGSIDSGTNQRHLESMFEVLNLSAGSHDIEIFFAGSANNGRAAIYRGTMSIEKWGLF